MFCEKCGAPISEAARFCAACGAAVTRPDMAETASTRDSGPAVVPDNVRKARLAQAIQQEVLEGGRIEAQGEFNAVIRFDQPMNHVLHLILTLVTFGLWALVWIVTTSAKQKANRAVTLNVDEYGKLLRHVANAQELAFQRIQQSR